MQTKQASLFVELDLCLKHPLVCPSLFDNYLRTVSLALAVKQGKYSPNIKFMVTFVETAENTP